MTNEQRALAPQCPACGAPPGKRCTEHLTSNIYRVVHHQRGKLAGLNPNEILRLDFGDLVPLDGSPYPTALEVLVREARPDDLRLALFIASVAIALAERSGASSETTARLRAMVGKLVGPSPVQEACKSTSTRSAS